MEMARHPQFVGSKGVEVEHKLFMTAERQQRAETERTDIELTSSWLKAAIGWRGE